MSNYEEWTELFKSEAQNHLEIILQNDYDEHYYASYLKSLEENPQEEPIAPPSDAHEKTTTTTATTSDYDMSRSSIQTEIFAIVLFSCVLLWLSLQVRKMWKNKSRDLESTKELPYFHTHSPV